MNIPEDMAALLEALQAEIPVLNSAGDVHLQIGRMELNCLIAALQLALRHPHYPEASKLIVTQVTKQLIEAAFEDFPVHLEMFRKGFDQRYDDHRLNPDFRN